MTDHEKSDICKGPVLPEPVKEETLPDLEPVTIDCSLPPEPEPAPTSQRRANFAAPDTGKGSGIDSLGQGNLP
jgi:hypothetical protein